MTEPQSKALTPINDFRMQVEKMQPQFKAALPPHVTPEKFVRVLTTAVTTTPKVLECDRTSLYAAAMKAAQDGLLPDGRESALIPFGGQVKYIPMVAGILKKIRNSGELSSITAEIVYEKDTFNYWLDSDGPHLEHRPNLFSDRGAAIGVYGLAKTKDGGVYFEPMSEKEVMAVRNVSKSKIDSPWEGPFKLEMWRKSALKRLSKKLPMSTDIESVLDEDNDLYNLGQTTTVPAPAKTTSSRLSGLVGGEDEGITEPVIEPPATQVPGDQLPI